MIYLCHPSGRIEACETEACAARLEEKGFVRISRDEYVERWKRKDQWGVERAVGETARELPVGKPWWAKEKE